jgi:micrococcal nuclease
VGTAVLVTRVVDGDTVHVNLHGKDTTVRILGIDTPETVDPGEPVECGGPQASAWAKQLLTGETVRLRTDPTQDTADKYGRTLAYLTLPNGTDYSILAARKGYAKAYTYDVPVQEAPQIEKAQAKAKAADRGLWGPPCHGVTTAAATPTTTQTPQTTQASPLATKPPPVTGSDCEPGYSPCLPITSDLDCSDVTGPVHVTGSDPYRLDRDGDGIGCETS